LRESRRGEAGGEQAGEREIFQMTRLHDLLLVLIDFVSDLPGTN
jgi:hypothetical protein